MKRFSNFILSVPSAVVLMMVFAISIAIATFIENDYGTQTAHALIYNARWFEFLLLLLGVNLIYNIVHYRMWRRGKRLVFLFHLAFIVILIGAAITRYFGYEGTMHIRNGETSNKIISYSAYLQFDAFKAGKEFTYNKPVLFSKIGSNYLKQDIRLGSDTLKIEVLKYIPNATKKLVADPKGKAVISMMIAASGRPEQILLEQGSSYETPAFVIAFDTKVATQKPVIQFNLKDGKIEASLPFALQYLKMSDKSSGVVQAGEHLLQTGHLYSSSGINFVIRSFMPHAKIAIVSAQKSVGKPMARNGLDALKLRLSIGGKTSDLLLYGSKGYVGEPKMVEIDGWKINASYGSRIIKLPFALKLIKFDLTRYPGSMSPSSYASEVMVIDPKNGVNRPFKIYMNHVLDYQNYRFFQSSYDLDEKGTILSVNHDPGTLPTYIGYLMLAIGMFGSMLTYSSRFQTLMRRARELQKKARDCTMAILAMIAFLGLSSYPAHAAAIDHSGIVHIDKDHAEKFGTLLVQTSGGRVEPVDTLARDVLHKLSRKDKLFGMNADQIFLGMIVRPDAWQNVKMIKISLPPIKKIIGIPSNQKYASFNDFFDFKKNDSYKLAPYVQKVTRTRAGIRTKLDNEILKVDERVNICYMTYTGTLLRIFPDPRDKNGGWHAPLDAVKTFGDKHGQLVQAILASYFSNIDKALKSNDWSKADKALDVIKSYQIFYGAAIIPSKGRIKAELFMNKYRPFHWLIPLYIVIGLVLLFLSVYHIINPKFNLKWPVRISASLLVLGFAVHTIGLGLRWYISAHPPWSNGYEAMLYISWVTMLAGFIFSRRSPITLAVTGILSGVILFVQYLGDADPQITNLVPVLKSYWLKIHVSIITASYGFLALGALLAFVILWLYAFKSDKNRVNMELSIRELTHINEMTLIFGLSLLTVGNFLGAVWANESWGRYWSWDPKETWALVSILVYASVLHIRFYKPLKGMFAFNVASLLAFSSVIMTYFGVNYYLGGMHSYAKGDPVPIPTYTYYIVAVVIVTIVLAYRKRDLLPIKK